MKKSSKGEVVLSPCQVQAARLNKLENRRLQRHVHLLEDDLGSQLARLHRQEQGLRYHYSHVVRVIKPNAAYQRWKQAHAKEIAQDEAEELIQSIKRKQRSLANRRQSSAITAPSKQTSASSATNLRPLLLLVNDPSEKSTEEFSWDLPENFLRPRTSPTRKPETTKRRFNPLMNMLHGNHLNSNPTMDFSPQRSSASFESPSSIFTSPSRKLVQGNIVTDHKVSDLDAMYRMALQNQTAYKSIDPKRLNQQKLLDKEFASQYRALHGTIRSAGVVR